MLRKLIDILSTLKPDTPILYGYKSPSEIPAGSSTAFAVALVSADCNVRNRTVEQDIKIQLAYIKQASYEDIDEFKQESDEIFKHITLTSEYVLTSIEYAYNDMYLFALATFTLKVKN